MSKEERDQIRPVIGAAFSNRDRVGARTASDGHAAGWGTVLM